METNDEIVDINDQASVDRALLFISTRKGRDVALCARQIVRWNRGKIMEIKLTELLSQAEHAVHSPPGRW